MEQNTVVNYQEILRKKGFKLTAQRQTVLQVMSENSGKHLSAEEIYELVKVKNKKIGLATVYRTLQLMDEIGIISSLIKKNEFSKYELNTDKENCRNPHLICTKCNGITEINEDFLVRNFLENIWNKYKFSIEDIRVSFYGVCKECSKSLS